MIYDERNQILAEFMVSFFFFKIVEWFFIFPDSSFHT